MKARELIRHLLEIDNLDSEVRAINVNDPQDEFISPADIGGPFTSVVVLDDTTAAVYYIGTKPARRANDEDELTD